MKRTSSYSLVGGGIERPSFPSSLSSQSRSVSISYQETFYSRARETKVSLLIPHRRRDNASQRLASSPHKAAPPTRSVRAFRQHSAVLAASRSRLLHEVTRALQVPGHHLSSSPPLHRTLGVNTAAAAVQGYFARRLSTSPAHTSSQSSQVALWWHLLASALGSTAPLLPALVAGQGSQVLAIVTGVQAVGRIPPPASMPTPRTAVGTQAGGRVPPRPRQRLLQA